MKFSEIDAAQWPELQPYLDTCLLPVTGLDGAESPWEAAEALEGLRDVLDLIEIPFRGRTVTYPAVHFFGSGQAAASSYILIEDIVQRLRSAGFRYVVLVSALPAAVLDLAIVKDADLVVQMTVQELKALGPEAKRQIGDQLTALWNLRESV